VLNKLGSEVHLSNLLYFLFRIFGKGSFIIVITLYLVYEYAIKRFK